jgi:hypothetical protein
MVTSQEAECLVRLLRHCEGHSLTNATRLGVDVGFLAEKAAEALGIRVDINKARVLETLSLAVRRGAL